MAEIEDLYKNLSTNLSVPHSENWASKPFIFYRFAWITSQFLINLLLPRDYKHFTEDWPGYTQKVANF